MLKAFNIKKCFEIIPSIFSDHNAVRLDVKGEKLFKIPTYAEVKQHAAE